MRGRRTILFAALAAVTYCETNPPTVEECGPLDEPDPLCESNDDFGITCTSTWHCIQLS